jgi:endonuclease-3
VLIATILSQRTRDENTELAASRLFARYNTPQALAGAPLKHIEELVKPSGFYREKAKRIKEVSKIIVEKHSGRVPSSLENLIALPGVGRKTAQCVRCYGFSLPAICVDVHAHRIANRLGIAHTKTPEQTELALESYFPKKYWRMVNHWFVRYGQQICKSKPKCNVCAMRRCCTHYLTSECKDTP